MAKITKLQIDFLKVYLTCFGNAYISLMGKKIESIQQLCEIIENKVITFEDVWDDYLSRCFGERLNKNLTDDEEDFFYANLDAYEYENYFTLDSKKDIGEGAWIKVRTANGFEIHYAKKSTRKIRLNEVYEAEQNKVTKALNKAKKVNTIDSLDDALKTIKNSKLIDAKIRYLIQVQPLQVRIQRTKTKVEYFYPYQYEIIDNIDEYCEAYLNKTPCLTIKPLYTAQNKDAIFYLQSRGISKRNAEIMAALNQTYFIFNMVEATEVYNNYLKENLVIKEI